MNYKKAKYTVMNFLGVEGLYTKEDINLKTVPKHLNKYSIRANTEDEYGTIELCATHNHTGDFITDKEINLSDDNNYRIDINNRYHYVNDEDKLNKLLIEYGVKEA